MKITLDTPIDIILKSRIGKYLTIDVFQIIGGERIQIEKDLVVKLPTNKNKGSLVRVQIHFEVEDVRSFRQGNIRVTE